MLSHKKSLNILRKTNALLEGHFVLSSGLHSSKYIQCAKLLSFPNKSEKFTKSLASKIKKTFKNIDLILSPAMGGIVIGYEIGKEAPELSALAQSGEMWSLHNQDKPVLIFFGHMDSNAMPMMLQQSSNISQAHLGVALLGRNIFSTPASTDS